MIMKVPKLQVGASAGPESGAGSRACRSAPDGVPRTHGMSPRAWRLERESAARWLAGSVAELHVEALCTAGYL